MNFWQKLKKEKAGEPLYVIAPMADVTDVAFRTVIAKYGKPDVMWTEFVSADGLCSEKGRKVLLKDLEYGEGERPIVAQIFSGHPDKIREAVKLVRELGFDGVDLNMGCPDKKVEKQKGGAALIKDPESAVAIIRAAQEGAGDLPVSVKTRIGYNKNEIETWIPKILETKPAVLTVHARTRKEMSKVPAKWEELKKVVALRNEISPETLIIGNGDVTDLDDARKKVFETGVDGAMLGRAIFGNPWLFNTKVKRSDLSLDEIFRVMLEHTRLFEEKLGTHKSNALMKKHYKAYIEGFDNAKELRMECMEAGNVDEVEKVLKNKGFLQN